MCVALKRKGVEVRSYLSGGGRGVRNYKGSNYARFFFWSSSYKRLFIVFSIFSRTYMLHINKHERNEKSFFSEYCFHKGHWKHSHLLCFALHRDMRQDINSRSCQSFNCRCDGASIISVSILFSNEDISNFYCQCAIT